MTQAPSLSADRIEHTAGARALSLSHAALAFGLLLLILYLTASLGTPVCFDDCRGYIVLMGKPWPDYLTKIVKMYRPWAVPAFFSLFGPYSIESASRIVLAQSFIAFFAWLSFAYSASLTLRTPGVRRVGFVILSLLMFGQSYYAFNQFLVSDSLALSAALYQWSLILLFPRFAAWSRQTKRNTALIYLYVISIGLISAFEMATRDANIMMALTGWAFLLWFSLTGVFRTDPHGREILYQVSIALFIVAICQSDTAKTRHWLNAENIMAGAIIPNPEVRTHFIGYGMPACLQNVLESSRPQDLANIDYHEIDRIRALMRETRAHEDCRNFLDDADTYYLRFLVTHPEYVVSNTWRNWRLIFAFQFMRGKETTAIESIHPGDKVPFLFGANIDLSIADYFPVGVGVALFASCFALPWLRRDSAAWLPLALSLIGVGNALLGFFGDAWERSEMSRHAAIGSVILRCGLTLCALMLLDEAARRAPFRHAPAPETPRAA